MNLSGTIVLCEFPFVDKGLIKLRPCMVVTSVPGEFDDFLTCMITTNMTRAVASVDELLTPDDSDFSQSGLKKSSVLRICRVAVINKSSMMGRLGNISPDRLSRVRSRLADWVVGKLAQSSPIF
jgi:mRNA interferase MazF